MSADEVDSNGPMDSPGDHEASIPQLETSPRERADFDLSREFELHRQRLVQMIKFRLDPVLATRVDADDVLQEAWLAANKRIDHFLSQDQWSAFVWLRMIVGQTIVDLQRHHLGTKMRDAYRETAQRDPLAQSTTMSIAAHLLGQFATPSQEVMRKELSSQLSAAVEAMDPIDREVLALRHFEELTNNEVAEVLGIQVKAASIRYVRAIKRLKQILQRLPEFENEAERD